MRNISSKMIFCKGTAGRERLRNRLLWCHWCVLGRVAGLVFGVDRERLKTLRRVVLFSLCLMMGLGDKGVVVGELLW